MFSQLWLGTTFTPFSLPFHVSLFCLKFITLVLGTLKSFMGVKPKHVALGKNGGTLKGKKNFGLNDRKEQEMMFPEVKTGVKKVSAQEKSDWKQFECCHKYADIITLKLSIGTPTVLGFLKCFVPLLAEM